MTELADGTGGLMVVCARGGAAIVQDHNTAMFSSMTQSTLNQVPEACVLPLAQIPAMIVQLARKEIPELPDAYATPNGQAVTEAKFAELDISEIERGDRTGHPSAFACPNCGGVLWEIENGGLLRFRRRVGHPFTARHLRAEQRQAFETALCLAL
jgi:two-component system, chemotaxis family, protein-glutamate methylesterase/glutaminase